MIEYCSELTLMTKSGKRKVIESVRSETLDRIVEKFVNLFL